MMNKIFKNNREKGLTLIEVLASLVIVSIVLISFSGILIQSMKHTKYNKEKLTEVDIAEEVIGEIRDGLQIDKATGFTRKVDLSPGFTVTATCHEQLTEIRNRNDKDVEVDLGLTRIEVEVITDDAGQKKSAFKTELYMGGACQ